MTETKTPGQFRYRSTGDWHLGHHLTTTDHILQGLYKHLANAKQLAPLDAVFITGDVYDRLLHQNDDQVHDINAFITRFLFLCAIHKVTVVIVEGTPSHDWQQSRFFIEQARNAEIPVDIHYATQLSVVHLERFDADILMVPDKWRTHTSETLTEARELLYRQGLDQVDFAIMHGAFEYQLPEIVPEPSHDSDAYHALVRHQILIGHVHTSTTHDRILAAGSFDRLIHGEEEAKGFFDVTLYANGRWESTFIENTHAKRYVTVDCRDLETREVNVLLRKKLKDLPKGSGVRIWHRPNDAAAGDLKSNMAAYPHFEWTTKPERDKKARADVLNEVLNTTRLDGFTAINRTTIEQLLTAELERRQISDEQKNRCAALLRPTVH